MLSKYLLLCSVGLATLILFFQNFDNIDISHFNTFGQSQKTNKVPSVPGMAFGLNPFLDPRPQTINGVPTYFRADFMPIITNPANWSGIAGMASEYEMYFETLQGAKAYPNEVDLKALAAALNSQNLSITFQVGGARPINGACSNVGAAAAAEDIPFLQNWLNQGGRIDKLISDNSFRKFYQATPSCFTNTSQFMSLVASEQAAYFKVMMQAFPNIKIGVTDALGIFEDTDPNGTQSNGSITYYTSGPNWVLATFDFQTYQTDLVQAFSDQGLVIDEFVMDFGEGYVGDAKVYSNSKYILQGRNYGRLFAAMKVLQSVNIAAGIYWEVFPASGSEAQEEQAYHDLTVEQVAAFEYFGGSVAHQRFTYWTDLPAVSGPETAANTALNDILYGLRAATGSSPLAAGNFQILPTIYSSNITSYCVYDSWSVYLADGGSKDLSKNLSVTSIPTSMLYTGSCPITTGIFLLGTGSVSGANSIFYSSGSHYCKYESWSSFVQLTGRTNTEGLRAVDRIPPSMVSDGYCQ